MSTVGTNKYISRISIESGTPSHYKPCSKFFSGKSKREYSELSWTLSRCKFSNQAINKSHKHSFSVNSKQNINTSN